VSDNLSEKKKEKESERFKINRQTNLVVMVTIPAIVT
jgi:hypothetical protein